MADHVLCAAGATCHFTECPLRRLLSGRRPTSKAVCIIKFLFKFLEFALILSALVLLLMRLEDIKKQDGPGFKMMHRFLLYVVTVVTAFTIITALSVFSFIICSPITRTVDATLCLLGFLLVGAAGIILLLPQITRTLCNADDKNKGERSFDAGKGLINEGNETSDRERPTPYAEDEYFERPKRVCVPEMFESKSSDNSTQKEPTADTVDPEGLTATVRTSGERILVGERNKRFYRGERNTARSTILENNRENITNEQSVSLFEQKVLQENGRDESNFWLKYVNSQQQQQQQQRRWSWRRRRQNQQEQQKEGISKPKLESREPPFLPRQSAKDCKEILKRAESDSEESKENKELKFMIKIMGLLCVAAAILMLIDVFKMGFCDMYY